ncbi:1969_t:CDS:2, partial [Paraglomus occultum]
MHSKEDLSYTQKDSPTVLETLREIEELDSTGILKCVDQHMVGTYNAITRAAKLGASRLLSFDELPKEWQENPYIRSGYRFLTTKRACLQSIFYLHNETCNIWTHLIGFIFFLCLGIYTVNTHLKEASAFDKVVFGAFFIAAAK